MSVLVVGVSHRTAPIELLERVVLDRCAAGKLGYDAIARPHLQEVVVLSTCNRVEVYADTTRFHAGLADVSELLARHAGIGLDELTPYLYVHYEDRAVQHVFEVACGLDSMVVGESQILGQVRTALHAAQEAGTAGRVLNELLQQALRVGKRAHAETGIDAAGPSLVAVGLALARAALGELRDRPALVVGAGSMSALAATTLRRAGVGELMIANRTEAAAQSLAARVGGRAVPLTQLESALARADLVVSCTGAVGAVIRTRDVSAARMRRPRTSARPQVFLDLALPRDIAPEVKTLDDCVVVDLERLAALLSGQDGARQDGARQDGARQDGAVGGTYRGESRYGLDVEAVRALVAEEVSAFLSWQSAFSVAPTVVALRAMAADVVSAELARLSGRLAHLPEQDRNEVAVTVRRVVDKLLHAPTVRVKQLASGPSGPAYAQALRELFDLDPAAVAALSRADLEPQPGATDPAAPQELQ